MNYDSVFLEKVRAFGVLGYSVHKIVDLVDPENVDQFILDFQDPDSPVYLSYRKGKTTGEYTLDKALFDQAKGSNIEANEKLNQRQRTNRVDDAIRERFNI